MGLIEMLGLRLRLSWWDLRVELGLEALRMARDALGRLDLCEK